MKIKILVIVFSLLFFMLKTVSLCAQYEKIKETESVSFAVKWASEKWYNPKGAKVLLVKVKNANDHPVIYTLGVDVSRDGVMLESAEEVAYCLTAHRTIRGRLNGLVFPMVKLTQEDIQAKNFDLELTGLTITKTEECATKK